MVTISDTEEQRILTIVAERAALGPLGRDLFGLYQRWQNDFEVRRTLHPDDLYPLTIEQTEADLAEDLKPPPHRSIHFTVYEHVPLRPVGTRGLFRVNHGNRSAIWRIVIGEADARGKGLGSEPPVLGRIYTGGA